MAKSILSRRLLASCVISLMLGASPVCATPATTPVATTAVTNPHKPTTGPAASLRAENPAAPAGVLHTNASGLLATQMDGAFPPEFWSGQSAGQTRELLTKLAPNPDWPAGLMLGRRLLLSDVQWPDDDLMPLRLERMIDFGAAAEAAKLYGHLAPDEPGVDLLQAGLRALLIAGEPSVACLEYKANAKAIAADKDPFWLKIATFCDGLIAREQNDDAPTPQAPAMTTAPVESTQTSPETKVSAAASPAVPGIFELAAAPSPILVPKTLAEFLTLDPFVVESHRALPGLSLAGLATWDVPSDISPAVAATLSHRPDVPLGLQLKLFTLGSDTDAPAAHEDDPKTPAEASIWGDIANLYRAQAGGITAGQRAAFARKVLALPDDTPIRALTLFADTLARLPATTELTPHEVRRLLTILLAVDADEAGAWIPVLRANLGNNPQHSVIDSALLLLAQTRGHPGANGKYPLSFSQLEQEKQPRLQKIFKNLSELLDTPPSFIDNPPNVYEKKTGLTEANHYVMPLSVLRNHLSDAKEKRQLGRVVLAGLLTLQTEAPGTVSPEAADEILTGLIGTGLGEEARQIATSVLLGVIELGEK